MKQCLQGHSASSVMHLQYDKLVETKTRRKIMQPWGNKAVIQDSKTGTNLLWQIKIQKFLKNTRNIIIQGAHWKISLVLLRYCLNNLRPSILELFRYCLRCVYVLCFQIPCINVYNLKKTQSSLCSEISK